MLCVAMAAAAAVSGPGGAGAADAPWPPASFDRAPMSVVAYSCVDDQRVHLLSAQDLSPVASIDAGVNAHELAIAPGGRWIVGSALGGPGATPDARVVVLDLTTGLAHGSIPLPRRNLSERVAAGAVAFLPGMLEAMLSVEAAPYGVRLDPARVDMSPRTADPRAGRMVAVSPDGARAYISHATPGSVSVVDLMTGRKLADIAVPMGADGIAVSPDGTRVWVACPGSGSVSVIDASSNLLARTIECRGFPFRIRISADGRTVAVSCATAGEVALLDADRPENLRRVNVRGAYRDAGLKISPTSLSFVPGTGRGDPGRLAVLCDGAVGQIVLVDVKMGEVVARVTAAGPVADGLAAGMALVPRATPPAADLAAEPAQDRKVIGWRPA